MKKFIWTILYFIQQKIKEIYNNVKFPVSTIIVLMMTVGVCLGIEWICKSYPLIMIWSGYLIIILGFILAGFIMKWIIISFIEWIISNWEKAKLRAERKIGLD